MHRKISLGILTVLFLFPAFLNLYAQDAEGLFKEGTALIKNGRYDLAVNKLEECLKANPGHLGCSCNLSVAYAYKKETAKAIEILEKVIYKEPVSSRGILFYNLARLYKVNGDTKNAVDNYSNALYLLPNFAQPYTGMAELSFQGNDNQKGNDYLHAANSMDSFMPDMWAQRQSQERVGYVLFSKDKDILPPMYLYQSPAWHISLAINYMLKNELDNSLAEIDKAASSLDQNSPLESDKFAFTEVYIYRGNVYLLKKDWDRAEQEYLKAYNINPRHIGAVTNLGALYYYKGNYEQARKYCQMALDIDPKFIGAEKLKLMLENKGK